MVLQIGMVSVTGIIEYIYLKNILNNKKYFFINDRIFMFLYNSFKNKNKNKAYFKLCKSDLNKKNPCGANYREFNLFMRN